MINLTAVQIKEYLADEGAHCPFCGGFTAVETDTSPDKGLTERNGSREMRMYTHCDDCAERWVDVMVEEFVLRGIEAPPETKEQADG